MTHEEQQKMLFEQIRQQREAQHQFYEGQAQAQKAQQQAQEVQQEINNTPKQHYALIVAVDSKGGFSKEKAIPWNFSEDLKWFQERTNGHICVMGRNTYNEINNKMGEKGNISVLPNRKCFVVTSSPLPRNNATQISSLIDLQQHLLLEDIHKTVFIIGGKSLYSEGIAKANSVYVTVINKDYECDSFFPVKYLMTHFIEQDVIKPQNQSIRFVTFRRR
jgi:dihydrofolate reductase